MDTGQVDFGRYLVELPSDYMAGTTLALSASSGASTIKVTDSTGITPGVAVTVGGDRYLLDAYQGADVWHTATPLRATYSSGAAVAAPASVMAADPPRIDHAYAGPDRPLKRIYQTAVEEYFNGLGVFTAPVVGDESRTLFVRGLGTKVTNWTLVAIEINAAGWRGLLPSESWKGGSRPTHPVQAWDGFAYSGAPERDGPYLVFGEQFSDDYSGWDSVQVAPGGIPYNSGGAGYGGSASLRFEEYLGRNAMHVKLSPGEAPISGLPTFRAEVAVPGGVTGLVHDGAERWISFDWRVAYDFPPVDPTDGWVLIHSMHHSGSTGTTPYQFTVDLNNILRVENPGTSTYLPFAPVEWFREKWRRITHHTFFSADDGWTEVYVDGVQMVPRTDVQTLLPDDATGYPKFGIYESENAVSVKEAGYANLRITAA